MVSVKSHTKRTKSGKTVRVRTHYRKNLLPYSKNTELEKIRSSERLRLQIEKAKHDFEIGVMREFKTWKVEDSSDFVILKYRTARERDKMFDYAKWHNLEPDTKGLFMGDGTYVFYVPKDNLYGYLAKQEENKKTFASLSASEKRTIMKLREKLDEGMN